MDSLHYIPPFGSDDSGNEAPGDVHIYFSTPSETPVNFTLTDAAGTATLHTGTVSSGSPYRYDDYGFPSGVAVKDNKLNTVLTTGAGFKVVADGLIYANLRVRSEDNAQAGSLTSKGQNAFGTEFRLGSIPNQQNNSNKATTFGITATEDDTTVEIDMTGSGVTLEGSGAPSTNSVITVQLDEGESYVMRCEANVDPDNLDGMIGTLVTSDHPIVVNTGSWNGEPTTSAGRDYGIDQIVGAEKIGTDYIFIRASGGDDREQALIVAHYDDTEIYVNGAGPVATIQAGEWHLVHGSNYSSNVMHVHTSKDVFAYQLLAGNNAGNTAGMNFVPDISCQIEDEIDAIIDIEQIGPDVFSGGVTITTFAGSQIWINGTLETSTPETVTIWGGDSYDIYKLSGLTGDLNITSSTMAIVSFFGVSGVAGYGGYFSGFARPQSVTISSDPVAPDATEGCQLAAFLAQRDGDLDVPLTVELSIGGTATAGVDYSMFDATMTPVGSSVTFNPGEANASFFILAHPDTELEVSETVEVTAGWWICDDYFSVTQTFMIYDPYVTVTCPNDTIIGFDPGSCTGGTFNFDYPVLESGCTIGLARLDGNGLNSGDVFPAGTSTITWQASINGGLVTDNCSYNVTVEDINAPVITSCSADLNLDASSGAATALVHQEDFESGASGWSNNATDSDNDFSQFLGRFAGSGSGAATSKTFAMTPGGTKQVEFDLYRFDSWDNEHFRVFVNGVNVISIPLNHGAYAGGSGASGSVSWTATPVGANANTAFSGWSDQTIHFTLDIADTSGSLELGFGSTLNQSINDESFGIDNIAIYEDDPTSCIATPTLVPPVYTDCSAVTVTNDAPESFALGTTTVTWTLTDASGYSSTCTQEVTVADNEPPNLTCVPVSVTPASGACDAIVTVPAPSATDNCGLASLVNDLTGTSDASGLYTMGTTMVTWTATDYAGNTATCMQEVTVQDVIAPAITCPADLVLMAGSELLHYEDFESGASGWSNNATDSD
ncbi:MAG: HYR domain-containing protein, partial [Flavobacteriales bacterium]